MGLSSFFFFAGRREAFSFVADTGGGIHGAVIGAYGARGTDTPIGSGARIDRDNGAITSLEGAVSIFPS